MDETVAALMLTVPNTLGLFEHQILEIADLVHSRGGFIYMDGANLNSFVGRALPGLMGADAMHINLHKTFSTPHGGGGPGAGPVTVSEALLPHLPVPKVIRGDDGFELQWEDPASIGQMRGFYGNFLILVRALTYIWSLGADGLRSMSDVAVLYANLIRHRLNGAYHLKYDAPSLHEVVFDDSIQTRYEVHNVDIAKRLLDYGFHPPTMSFPAHRPRCTDDRTGGERRPRGDRGLLSTPCSRSPKRRSQIRTWSRLLPTTRPLGASTKSARPATSKSHGRRTRRLDGYTAIGILATRSREIAIRAQMNISDLRLRNTSLRRP